MCLYPGRLRLQIRSELLSTEPAVRGSKVKVTRSYTEQYDADAGVFGSRLPGADRLCQQLIVLLLAQTNLTLFQAKL